MKEENKTKGKKKALSRTQRRNAMAGIVMEVRRIRKGTTKERLERKKEK